MKSIALVVSCEHAVNTVPEAYKTVFEPYQDLLKTHRGIDFGALAIALAFSKFFNCDFIQAHATRLLIDCNRSLKHPQCFSEVTAPLPKKDKELLIQQYYLPLRQQVEKAIKLQIQRGQLVLHLSIHSFTETWNETPRNTDLGLLYDPSRVNEKSLAKRWQQELKQQDTKLRVRMNYPYRGVSDGFTTALRKQFAGENYMGIEIEANQNRVGDQAFLNYLAKLLPQTLGQLIDHSTPSSKA